MAAVLNLSALTKGHKAVSCAAFPVAGSAEAWDIAQFHEPVYNFIQGTTVTDIKLFRFCIFRFRFAVASHAGAGAPANLGNTKMQHTFSACLAFSGGNNHACVWYSNTDAGNNFCKGIVINSIVKSICINIICMAQTRHADGMRTNPKSCLQVFCMHEESCKLIAVFVQPKEYANTHIINTAFHSPVHGFCVIVIIMFRSRWMKLQIAFFVIGFLEENISADACLF